MCLMGLIRHNLRGQGKGNGFYPPPFPSSKRLSGQPLQLTSAASMTFFPTDLTQVLIYY